VHHHYHFRRRCRCVLPSLVGRLGASLDHSLLDHSILDASLDASINQSLAGSDDRGLSGWSLTHGGGGGGGGGSNDDDDDAVSSSLSSNVDRGLGRDGGGAGYDDDEDAGGGSVDDYGRRIPGKGSGITQRFIGSSIDRLGGGGEGSGGGEGDAKGFESAQGSRLMGILRQNMAAPKVREQKHWLAQRWSGWLSTARSAVPCFQLFPTISKRRLSHAMLFRCFVRARSGP